MTANTPAASSRIRVALVDDDPHFRLVMGSLFKAPALETAFNDERLASAKVRARILLPIGIVALAVIGYCEATVKSVESPEMLRRTLQTRFLGMIPPWLIIYISTFLPGYRQRADWLGALCTTAVCWVLGWRYWHFALLYPQTQIVGSATGALLSVLLVSAFTLTMPFRALAITTVVSFAGPLLFYWITLPADRGGELFIMSMTFAGVGLLLLFLGWYREAADRLMFAQREHVRALNTELAQLNAEKNEFIAIASHDLRSPLAAVQGLADQLVAGSLKEAKPAHLAIQDLSRGMLRLVENYLGAHAIEHGAVPVQIERIDLSLAAQEAVARHHPAAEHKGQRFVLEAGRPVRAHADPSLLRQVLDNFLSNALKFSPHGSNVRVAIAVAEDGSLARIEVTDEGPGIAPEHREDVFRKFHRTGTMPTGGETSHGLGLAVAKRLAESMGAEVGCESAQGTGATFWIALPAAETFTMVE